MATGNRFQSDDESSGKLRWGGCGRLLRLRQSTECRWSHARRNGNQSAGGSESNRFFGRPFLATWFNNNNDSNKDRVTQKGGSWRTGSLSSFVWYKLGLFLAASLLGWHFVWIFFLGVSLIRHLLVVARLQKSPKVAVITDFNGKPPHPKKKANQWKYWPVTSVDILFYVRDSRAAGGVVGRLGTRLAVFSVNYEEAEWVGVFPPPTNLSCGLTLAWPADVVNQVVRPTTAGRWDQVNI